MNLWELKLRRPTAVHLRRWLSGVVDCYWSTSTFLVVDSDWSTRCRRMETMSMYAYDVRVDCQRRRPETYRCFSNVCEWTIEKLQVAWRKHDVGPIVCDDWWSNIWRRNTLVYLWRWNLLEGYVVHDSYLFMFWICDLFFLHIFCFLSWLISNSRKCCENEECWWCIWTLVI